MATNKFLLGLTASAMVMSAISIYQSSRVPSVAYIRSADMIYSYDGMKDAQKQFQDKMLAWQANIDTLRIELERNFSEYSSEVSKLSTQDKSERQKLLSRQQQNYNQYTSTINEKSKAEEQKMTEGVLNQVNSFIEEYSKEKGYDIVIGTTTSGNLLYAKERMDITDEVLKELNKNYHTPLAKN